MYYLKLFSLLNLILGISITNLNAMQGGNTHSNIKPSQQRGDLSKLPLAAFFYQDIYKRSGKTLIKLKEVAEEIAKEYSGKAVIPPLKSFERTKEKVDTDYQGDWKKLTDLVRGSMYFKTIEDINNAMQKFGQSGLKIVFVKDRFQNPAPSGYRDINILFEDSENGVIGEIQFHLCHIADVKEQEHKIYEVIRSIEAKAKNELRKLSPEEQLEINNLRLNSNQLYDDALEASKRGDPCKSLEN